MLFVGNNTQEKLKVIFGEGIQIISPSAVIIDKPTLKKVLAPKEEDCFPDDHPLYKNPRQFAFMPVENSNHPDRLDPNPVIDYLAKLLPDFASIVASDSQFIL